jgi:hypothetical protein
MPDKSTARCARHARDLDQLAEHGAFLGIAEAEQQMRIFADGLVREQHHFLAHPGQVVEGAHGHIDFIADATAIDQQLGRIFSSRIPERRPIMLQCL